MQLLEQIHQEVEEKARFINNTVGQIRELHRAFNYQAGLMGVF